MAPKKTKKKAKDRPVVEGIRAPRDVRDPIDLADWLELVALTSADKNASKASLAILLAKVAGFDPVSERDSIEGICLSTFAELEARQLAAEDSYPFHVSPPLITTKPNALEDYPAYVFCLCLSAWRWMKPKERPQNARQLFEDLACDAARNYVGGDVIRFASPRAKVIAQFTKAVDHVCASLGEGGCFRALEATRSKKDDALDVVAWRQFPDKGEGKLVMFGQCASGADWRGKLLELDPDIFAKLWMDSPTASQFLRAFFIPHRVGRAHWKETNMKAGITFDRCRLSYWAAKGGAIGRRADMVAWYRSVIAA